MLQFNSEGSSFESNSSSSSLTPTVVTTTITDDRANYEALKSRIILQAEEFAKSGRKLGELLFEMRESKLWKCRYSTWDGFCRSLRIEGFNGYSSRRANQQIKHYQEVGFLMAAIREANPGTEVLLIEEWNEATTRELGRLSEEDRLEVATNLVQEQQNTGKTPTAPQVKKLSKKTEPEDTISLSELKTLWRSVGNVSDSTKYANGFYVYNPEFPDIAPPIDWDFQNKAEASKIWQKHGESYRAQIAQRKAEQGAAAEGSVDLSCFDCQHHERDGEVFKCYARNFPMAVDDDHGEGCLQWKSKTASKSPVAAFSLKDQPWAGQSRVETPFASQLEELKLLLDCLAEERTALEQQPLSKTGQSSAENQEQLKEIGEALEKIFELHWAKYHMRVKPAA